MLVINFVDGADVGMIQRRGGLGFALEARQRLRVFGNFVGQELEGDKAAKLDVFGLVDHTHAAAAEFLNDAVVRDGLADHWRESYVWETGKSMNAVELAGRSGREEAMLSLGEFNGSRASCVVIGDVVDPSAYRDSIASAERRTASTFRTPHQHSSSPDRATDRNYRDQG